MTTAASPNTTVSPLNAFYHWESIKPDTTYLQQPNNGQWQNYSWKEVGDQARRIAHALQSMGICQGERVCILSNNCAHWMISDLAIMISGGASAPAFTSMSAEDILYILEHSNSTVLIVGETANWEHIKNKLPKDLTVIAMPSTEIPEADHQWDDLIEKFSPLDGNPQRQTTDELTTIYTSGSTGKPKGVMYNFEGAYYVAANLSKTLRMTEEDRMISYLPMAHGFERGIVDWMSMYAGFTVGFNQSQATFSSDMQTFKPTVFQCVPRLWTKFQEGVVAKFGGQDALNALLGSDDTREQTKQTVKEALGLDKGRLYFTGSAPTPMPLHQWYEALDMPLCELYGQSEILSGTANLPWSRKPGTLGKPTHNTEIKISDVGEILIKANAVMTGYLNDPEKTAETLIDGWIHTGDKGLLDSEGFLNITGRVKEIFKTAKGKYVAPVPIEGLFVSNPHLEQVCLMGNGLPQTVLITHLSVEGKKQNPADLEANLSSQLESINAQLGGHEKIAAAIISAQAWTSDIGFITHTMKIKRSAIEKHFQTQAEETFKAGASIKAPKVFWE